ncbi:MAG: hypothetical protein ACHQ4F_16565, partial [Candidatus Dormibacteria bacterium]
AKVLVRDPGAADHEVFAGSQNFSRQSLGYNRELGIAVRDEDLASRLQAMIQDDYSDAVPWSGGTARHAPGDTLDRDSATPSAGLVCRHMTPR